MSGGMGRRKKGQNRNPPMYTTGSGIGRVVHLSCTAWGVATLSASIFDLILLMVYLSWTFHQPTVRGELFFGLLLFAAAVVGVMSLVLLPVVLKLSQTRPSRGLCLLGILAAAAPLVVAVMKVSR